VPPAYYPSVLASVRAVGALEQPPPPVQAEAA
jgi:hypothetical protein